MSRHPVWRRGIKTLSAAAGAAVACGAIYVVFILPTLPIPGAADLDRPFEFDTSFTISRRTPSGVEYSVNNSLARFKLDVADSDGHCERLFTDYAAALSYCRDNGLPVIPSVQLIQGKCKQFDDGLCAVLEQAVQERLGNLGRQQALERLLARLCEVREEMPADRREAVERAIVHVAASVRLGGGEPGLTADLARQVAGEVGQFDADPMRSRPTGFWARDPKLECIFRQGRYLSRGFRLDDDADVCVALARAASSDPAVSDAFDRLRRLHSGLTNPPVYVDPNLWPAPPARAVSCADLAAQLPRDATLADLLAPAKLSAVRARLSDEFGPGAGFALVTHAGSKEYALLYALWKRGEPIAGESSMDAIIGAIREGQLDLAPKPDSGWYDYQWHALETLVAPDRAPEAAKLVLSDAYRRRLADAFKAALTKHRETHIQRLPVITMGVGETPPAQVIVRPEFCAEPTVTVYLRTARSYRFLRNMLHAVLGQKALTALHRSTEGGKPVELDLGEELRQMALLCYGLYDRACLEMGLPPKYLTDEIPPLDLEQARDAAARWTASLADDPELARDVRVAVPMLRQSDEGPARYWATGGVRLERVVYAYLDEPAVGGDVEPVFKPAYLYLPTDVFVEFESPGAAPPTRQEFQARCDRCGNVAALYRAFNASPPDDGGPDVPWLWLWLLAAVAGVVVAGFCCRERIRRYGVRRLVIRLGVAATAVVVAWSAVFLLCPGYRARILTKYVARINAPVGLMVERWLEEHPSAAAATALVDLMRNSDPQVRYLAARFVPSAWPRDEQEAPPDLDTRLRAVAEDSIPQVRGAALWALACYPSRENETFLVGRLAAEKHVDNTCSNILRSLRRIGRPGAIDTVLPFTGDPRRHVRSLAWEYLTLFDDDRVTQRLAEVLLLPDPAVSHDAASGVYTFMSVHADSPHLAQIRAALVRCALDPSRSPSHRTEMADHIDDQEKKAQAYASILGAVHDDTELRAELVKKLKNLGSKVAE